MAEISGKRFERQSVIAAQCGKKILAPFGYSGTCDTELFNFWIESQLIPNLRKKQIVVLDNAPIHRSQKTRKLIELAGSYLIFLPTYSPDLNPIEHTWAHKKQYIRTNMHKFSSLTNAMQYAFS